MLSQLRTNRTPQITKQRLDSKNRSSHKYAASGICLARMRIPPQNPPVESLCGWFLIAYDTTICKILSTIGRESCTTEFLFQCCLWYAEHRLERTQFSVRARRNCLTTQEGDKKTDALTPRRFGPRYPTQNVYKPPYVHPFTSCSRRQNSLIPALRMPPTRHQARHRERGQPGDLPAR